MMLRTVSAEDYDAWTTNELPFNDPKVIAAIEEFGWFARDDAKVAGGAGAVASTDFRQGQMGQQVDVGARKDVGHAVDHLQKPGPTRRDLRLIVEGEEFRWQPKRQPSARTRAKSAN